MLISDKVSGTALVALGSAAAYGGSLLPPVPGQQVGPNVFPMVVGIGLALCGVLIAFGVGSVLEQEAEADQEQAGDFVRDEHKYLERRPCERRDP